ncbi:MAG: hypothetical protein ABH884_04555, partial [Candidatus Komeilibacteria bacterium]
MQSNILTKKIIYIAITFLVLVGILGYIQSTFAQADFGLEDATAIGLAQGDLRVVIINLIRFALGFLGLVMVILILYGGFLWMTSGGDQTKIAKARRLLTSAIIGSIIILSAFIIASFVINIIGGGIVGPPNPGDDCNIEGDTESCDSGCGEMICQADLTWGDCIDTGDCSSQDAYIKKLRDDSIPWVSKKISRNFSGVLSIPASATLQVKGYAKNEDGTIDGMDLYSALLDDPLTLESSFIDVPIDVPEVLGVLAPWNSSLYPLQNKYQIMIEALLPSGLVIESRVVNTIVRPLHCFNGEVDEAEGETGVDCGGDPEVLGDNYCGACGGTACEIDDDCADGVCIEGFCVNNPIIFNIDLPDGAPGNYATIYGRYFGNNPGRVVFMDGEQEVDHGSLDLYEGCEEVWSDRKITFEIPNVATEIDYDVEVITNSAIGGLSSESEIFTVNDVVRPGVCGISPIEGINPDLVEIFGNNIPEYPNGQVVWYFGSESSPDNATSTQEDWIDANNLTDIVPARGVGRTGFRIYNGAEYSNFSNFTISRGELGDPCGTPDTTTCSASNICNDGLFCNPNGDPPCSCAEESISECEPEDTMGCMVGLCEGVKVCPISGIWDEVCTQVDPSCIPGLVVPPATSSIFTWAFNTLEVEEPPSIDPCEPESTRDCTDLDPDNCESVEVCPASGVWDEAVCVKTDLDCPFEEVAIPAATRSVYAWGFAYNRIPIPPAPEVIEDCNRVSSCHPDQELPSPSPWYEGDGATEGWDASIHPGLHIINPLACTDALIYVRFTEGMDASSVEDNTVVLRKIGEVWQEVGGLSVVIEDASNSFKIIPSSLESNSNYKVVLKEGIRSYIGVPMNKNETVVSNRDCNVGGISDAVYCWNFETRANAIPCTPGCPECSEDPTYMFYYSQTEALNADLIAEENVCLMIDPWGYDWDWSSESTSTVTISSYDIFTLVDDVLVKPGDGLTDPLQTATSTGENYNIPPGYTKVFAELTQTGNNDYCRVINDFTNPIVIEDKFCEENNVQSPTPFINSEDACVNALIGASFSRDMVDGTINKDNIKVYSCDEEDCDTPVSVNSPEVIIYNISPDPEVKVFADRFTIAPITSPLDTNKWYKVVIIGGDNGVRGENASTGLPDGVLKNTNCNGDNDKVDDDYCWMFKTGSEECDIDKVQVDPRNLKMENIGDTHPYNADAIADNCNIINPAPFSFVWRSLIDLGDDTDEGNTAPSGSGFPFASIFVEGHDTSTTTVQAVLEGEVKIKARVKDTHEPDCLLWNDPDCGDKWGYGNLQIGLGSFQVNNYKPKNRVDYREGDIDIGFTIDAKSNTFNNSSISIYTCTDENCSEFTIPELTLVFPAFNEFSKDFTISTNEHYGLGIYYNIGTYYRMVVRGGSGGVLAYNNDELAGLKWNSTGMGAGEECEPDIYPWAGQNVCNTTECLLDSSLGFGSLCGSIFAECKNTIKPSSEEDYCNNICHNTGNSNTSSCGDSIVGPDEECDDG